MLARVGPTEQAARRRRRLDSACQILILAALTWGVLSFGAVYPWAYWPLLVACWIVALLVVAASPPAAGTGASLGILAAALAMVAATVLIQVVPLHARLLARISPHTVDFLSVYDLQYASSSGVMTGPSHPLSILPRATWRGLAFFSSLAALFLATASLLSRTTPSRLAGSLVGLATAIALTGIIQKSMVAEKIYGFWTPQYPGSPFGPFVNRNHFAGWMLMAWPLAFGYLCAVIARGAGDRGGGWRQALLWFSSPDANRLVLVATAVFAMAASLVMTASRSGAASFLVVLILMSWFVVRAQGRISRKLIAAAYLLLLGFTIVGWVGITALQRRLDEPALPGLGRRGVWQDTLAIVRDFPMTGTGLNTYGTAMVRYQTVEVVEYHYAEAHNDYLQLAAEGGLLVGIPSLIVLGAFVLTVGRRFKQGADDSETYWLRAGAVGALVGIACQEVVDFSLQMPGNAALFAVVAAIAVHRSSFAMQGPKLNRSI